MLNQRRSRIVLVLALSCALLGVPSHAALDCGGDPQFFIQFNLFSGPDLPGDICFFSGFRCNRPEVPEGPFIRLANPSCDPNTQGCAVEVGAPLELPGNQDNIQDAGTIFGTPLPSVFWFASAEPPACNPRFVNCGQIAICGVLGAPLITTDRIETFITRGNVTCANVTAMEEAFSFTAFSCPSSDGCRQAESVSNLVVGGEETARAIGCAIPPKDDCDNCTSCPIGGASAGGGPPAVDGDGDGGTGPKATLRYRGGGAGNPGLPGTPAWNADLGRNWSHDYAERIFEAPDASHVWLITRSAVFREFTDGDADGVYETVSPKDEYRRLTKVVSGWELRELDGTVHFYGSDGRWSATTDRNGNARTASYTAGKLTSVSFPDGRREDFTYHPDGKLATLTEVGVDGTSLPAWSYTWSGDDLTRIDRPDGTALEFLYEDVRHPGFMTQRVLVGTGGARRVLRAWAYDVQGNVVETWRGDPSSTGPAAVDRYSFSFDDPVSPTQTQITDPLGKVATYSLERVSGKVRVSSVSGDCPTCSTGPNAQLFYDDPAHPLLVTREIDGNGHETMFEYDTHGRMTGRLEAVDTPALTRETTWEHDPTYPALPTRIERLSVTGGPEMRVTTFAYDASGNLLGRTETGVEDGTPFTLTTTSTYESTGQVMDVDPPGFGTGDVTSFTYDPARGGLLAATRTDPLIGTTTFGYDPFHRRTSVTDPNGVETTTAYDELDRVTTVTQQGATDPEDLVTENRYNEFGDLFRTLLPKGNVIEYGYDAAGRLISIERKPDTATPGERTFFTLDAAGNRIREQLQSWDGMAWVTQSETVFEYPTRCFLERVIRAPGTLEESITEYAYDCDGNLEKAWDENHPRFNPSETVPTQLYAYDALHRLTSVTQPWGGGGGDVVTGYGYDVQDHLVSVTDGEGNQTTYIYSDRDLLTREVSPVSGTTTFAYNDHGELVTRTDARGVTTTREVDELDRVTAVRYPTAALDTTYTYDDPLVDFSIGRLTAITRHGQSVAYEYDRFGRVTRDGALTYGYDANGNRTKIGYPGA